MFRIVYALVSLWILLLTCPVVSWGRMNIEPRLTLREEYNDNIYLDSENEESDFITTAIPGISFLMDSNYLNLDLDYGLEFRLYSDNNDGDETDINDIQRIRLQADVMPERDLTMTIIDEQDSVAIDERLRISEENSFVNKTNRNRLFVNPRYHFRANPTIDAVLGYQYERFDYASSEGDDSERHSGTFDLTKKLANRMSLSLGYRAAWHDALLSEDYDRQDVHAGFAYPITSKLTIEAGFGYAWISYVDEGDVGNSMVSAKLDYDFTSRLKGSVGYVEDYADSVTDGLYHSKALTASLTLERWMTAALALHGSQNEYTESSREDRVYGGGLTLTMPFPKKVNLVLRGDWASLRYLPEDVDVERYGVGGALNWMLRLVELSLGYSYRVDDSEIEVDDYRNNIVYVQSAFRF